jgi:hypothetical protein
MKTQSKEPRFVIIRQGPEYWEWRYREENPSAYRRTPIPRYIQPLIALTAVVDDLISRNGEVITGAWELTDEEKAAGKKGIPESSVPATGRQFGVD